MKLSEEDISKVMCRDLPEYSECASIIHAAQDAERLADTNFAKCQEASSKAWTDLMSVMARCIARGMRLAKEA